MPKLNPWLVHLAKFRKAHPGMPPTQVAKEARKTYKSAPAKRQRGGQNQVPPQILEMKRRLDKIFPPTGTPYSPHAWYETPFVGIKRAATHINNDDFTNKAVGLIPGAGEIVKKVAKQIGGGRRKRKR